MTDETTGPKWAPDPTTRHEFRYWDGTRWTDHVSDQGIQGVDAVTSDSSEPATSSIPEPAETAPPRAAQSAATLAPTEQFILTIGDIGVSPHWVVTPGGTAALAESVWICRDMSRTDRKTPT